MKAANTSEKKVTMYRGQILFFAATGGLGKDLGGQVPLAYILKEALSGVVLNF